MHIIAKKALVEFYQRPGSSDARGPLEAWYREVEKAVWKDSIAIKKKHRSASILKGGRVVFNINGNDYRIIVKIHYDRGIVFICFVGTHEEYDRVDAEAI